MARYEMITEGLIADIEKCRRGDVYIVSPVLYNRYKRSIGWMQDGMIIEYRKWWQFWKARSWIPHGYTSLTFRGIPLVKKDRIK